MSAVVVANHADVVGAEALLRGGAQRVVAITDAGPVSLQRFAREVRGVAATLPAAPSTINLCEDRYRFLVGFCAAALRGQTTLLPPSRAPAVIDQVLARHRHAYCLGDVALMPAPPRFRQLPNVLPQLDGAPLQIDDEAVVAIGFTSGSTGQPSAHPKTWRSFSASTAQNIAALGDLLHHDRATWVVATVPPQHMYGMEMSVLLPLLGPVAAHASRPFFPTEVMRVLAQAPAPPLLVTTPVHLQALVESGNNDPGLAAVALAGIVSATAPLSAELARAAEARFGCEVREMFGSTETCMLARRRTAQEPAWRLLPGVRLEPRPDGTVVRARHLADPVTLADHVELDGDERFHLRGRQADVIEIAGKRVSLGDLTRKLLAVPGVDDAAVFQLDQAGRSGVRRVAALAVAPGLSPPALLAALRASVDPVFLPRPLRCVARLPRNETGKLPRQALLATLDDTRRA